MVSGLDEGEYLRSGNHSSIKWRSNVVKKVDMYGRNSLEKARQYVQEHPNRDLVILKNHQTWRIAVCSPHTAQKLKPKGFRPVDSEA